jgi:tetratricopeptide (TPR) repeat protein
VDLAAPAAASAPRARARRWLPVAGIVFFAVAVALLLAQSVRDRDPGGALTGNDPATTIAPGSDAQLAALREAAEERPDDYAARIAYARVLLNRDPQGAVREFDAAAEIAPRQPEPLAYGGWIRSLVAGQLEPGPDRQLLVDAALERFAKAIEVAPAYEDAFVFRGITRLRVMGDTAGAVPDFQRFLQLAPQDHPQRELVLQALAQAVAATEGNSGTTTPRSTSPTP